MNTEWINTQENVPHRFISAAQDALALAKIQRIDGYGGLWAMIDPNNRNGFPFQPYVRAAEGVWPPVTPPLSEWTIDNVMVGDHTLREWFQADFFLSPPPTITGGIDAVTRTTATATPVVTAPAGDIIGTKDVALAMGPGEQPIVTRSLYQIGDLLAAGYRILRQDGTLANMTTFQGGWLADGEPLNVVLGRGWVPGQQEALVAAGITPVTDLTKVFSTGPSKLVVGGGIALVLLLLSRRKKS